MKTLAARIIMIIMLIAMASGLVYANTGITESDIKEGLEACKAYPVSLKLDNEKINFSEKDVPPVIIKERTLIPARALFEGMGGKVTWNNDTQSVLVTYDNTQVVLTIGSKTATVNGVAKDLEVPAMIIDHDGDYYGSTMIPVRFTAEALGCGVEWEDPTRSVVIQSPSKDNNSGNLNDNNSNTENNDSNANKDDDNANKDENSNNNGNSDLIWQFDALKDAAKDKLVVIDIGHGGKDSGSIGHKDKSDQLYEKDVNLAVGLRLNEYLRSAGVKTLMVRDSDVYYTLLERAEKANNAEATLFVSIHNNSNESQTPHGTEVLYNSKVNADGQAEKELYGIESKTLAKNVQDEMVKILGTHDRGVKNSPGMAVLNKTLMPAIIVEGAFLSNESNFAMMKEPDFADKYAQAVAKGIVKSLNEAFK